MRLFAARQPDARTIIRQKMDEYKSICSQDSGLELEKDSILYEVMLRTLRDPRLEGTDLSIICDALIDASKETRQNNWLVARPLNAPDGQYQNGKLLAYDTQICYHVHRLQELIEAYSRTTDASRTNSWIKVLRDKLS